MVYLRYHVPRNIITALISKGIRRNRCKLAIGKHVPEKPSRSWKKVNVATLLGTRHAVVGHALSDVRHIEPKSVVSYNNTGALQLLLHCSKNRDLLLI